MARRKKKHEKEPNHERWLVSYADFITLLFAFFIVMYATSQQDTEKAKQFENSIKKYLMKFGGFGESGPKLNKGVKYKSPIEPPIKKYSKGNVESQKVQLQIETYLEEKLTDKELEKVVKDISDDAIGVRISLAAKEIFHPDTAKFQRGALGTLNKIAKLLKQSKYRVIVEGHMDASPDKENLMSWEMASERATQVVKYLAKVHKISGSRLAAMSYGGERPIVGNDSEINRERNRRIDFLIVTADVPL